ncbi:MAG TPA: DUF1289 domain-containing protein [Paracoccaceae bacterium]|nr:DUF1289 domain-containing protein [Paracoccaceae bacterium]
MAELDGTDEVWKREEVESPCVKICVVHPAARLCTGCYRSIDEIGSWGRMTPEERRAVMAELPSRAGLLKQRRGGRAARLAGES